MDEQIKKRKQKKRLSTIVTLVVVSVFAACALAGCASEGQQPPGFWEVICIGVADIVAFFYPPFQDWGMAIIIVTIIFRLLIAPLMYKQSVSSFKMTQVQPKIREINERFANDPPRQQAEIQKLYAEAKFNPLAGCVPMLLQMPIFMALFQVLRNIDSYITNTGEFKFYNIVPDLLALPSDKFAEGFGAFLPYLILMVVFAGATFLPMVLQQRMSSDSSQKNQMYIMAGVMSLMMLWLGWSSPGGVLLFWGVSSILGVTQSQLTMRYLRKKAAAEEAATVDVKPVQVEVTRKAKKKRPSKKR